MQTFVDACANDGKQIIFTGHSQGGAAAAVAHIMFSDYDPLTISFGAPPFFSRHQDGDCGRMNKNHIWRFINSQNKDELFYSGIMYDPIPNVDVFDWWLVFVNVIGDHYGEAIVLPPGSVDGDLSPPTTSVAIHSSFFPNMGLARLLSIYPSKTKAIHVVENYLKKIKELYASVSLTGTLDTNGFIYKSRCFLDSECKSSLCIDHICQDGHVGDKCRGDDDCGSGRCDINWSMDIFCGVGTCYPKLSYDKICNEDSDCQSDYCDWFKCTETG